MSDQDSKNNSPKTDAPAKPDQLISHNLNVSNLKQDFTVVNWDELKVNSLSDEEKFKLLLSSGGGGSKVGCVMGCVMGCCT